MHGRAPGNRGRGRPRRCWVTDICEWTRSTPSQAIRLAEKRDLGGVYMRKLAPARVSYRDDFFISHRVYIMTESFHISLFEGTLHGDKINVRFKIANITHALPVPVYQQTDFSRKRMVVSPSHDTVARLHTGVKFSPRYNNRGELTPGWLALAWHFEVVSCRQM